jgi:hypothetical protein
MAIQIDLTGLPLLENELAALVAQAAPSQLIGGQAFQATATATKSGILSSSPTISAPGAMTVASLLARLQAMVALVQTLPQ